MHKSEKELGGIHTVSSGFTSISKCEPFRVFTKIFILGRILFYLSTAISTLENGVTDPQSPSAMCVCKFREREKKKRTRKYQKHKYE